MRIQVKKFHAEVSRLKGLASLMIIFFIRCYLKILGKQANTIIISNLFVSKNKKRVFLLGAPGLTYERPLNGIMFQEEELSRRIDARVKIWHDPATVSGEKEFG